MLPRKWRRPMLRSMRRCSRYVFIPRNMNHTIERKQSISEPLKEGHHFDQSLGGIAG